MTVNHNIFSLILRKIDDIHFLQHRENSERTLSKIEWMHISYLDSDKHIFVIGKKSYRYSSNSEDRFNRLSPNNPCKKCRYRHAYPFLNFRYRSEVVQHQKTYWCPINKIFNEAYYMSWDKDFKMGFFGGGAMMMALIGCYLYLSKW